MDAAAQHFEILQPRGAMVKRAEVRAGTMFGASPPCVTMPWTRSVGRMCWRRKAMAVWAMVRASPALMPSSGNAAACAALPV
jgi:hypothetical protein